MEALALAFTGLALIVTLAWIIGRVEANARNGAWQRIADARRDLHAKEQGLLACLGENRCSDCPIERYLGRR